jgi:hypothetical protein
VIKIMGPPPSIVGYARSVNKPETVNLFHPGYASRICNTWMALASWPTRQGQQRSLRRMCQVLSWAFARSPGARSFAWALLACFCDSGLPLPRYGILAWVLP